MRAALTLLALVAALALALPAAAAEGGGAGGESDRSRELVRLDCATDLDRREVTVFANGTIRLRVGPPGAERMALGELGASEVEAFVDSLAAVDLSEAEPPAGGPEGAWVERCVLHLTLPGRPAERFEFQRFDSLPLALARVLDVVAGVAGTVADPLGDSRLPAGYEPRPGDVLRRADGTLFEIVDFTSDGRGLELVGVEQPLTLYIESGRLRERFVELVERRREL